MPHVLIRDLPDDTHAVLRSRAMREGKSLQQYLFAELRQLAARPTVDELMDRVDSRSGGRVSFRRAVEDVAEDRHRH
ncbi:FitA-like ribbon-helix-helix domain-containing protein [Candidatus Spongiisocius sp.]|uniref:FitA-like ribbon-helix-helix domain-containing protein n=1 Tax=Candidatus Spongiisocius sp. TaxID=3101273 RepID=UPI003B5C784A